MKKKGRQVSTFSLIFSLLAAHAGTVNARERVMPPSDSTERLAISVSGHITPRCSLDTRGARGDFGDIMNAHTGVAEDNTLSLPFTMSCNTPYEAVMVSKNGALSYEGAVAPDFAGTVDYSAGLNMSQITGGLALRCDSSAMRGDDTDRSSCRTESRNDVAYASGNGTIDLKLKKGALPLQLGTYSDRLIFRLSPRV